MEPTLNLKIESLFNPIGPDFPSGEDLRYSEVYDQIKEARRADDQLEQGEWQTNLKTSDWRQVEKLGRFALAMKSKDLQIAAWLLEAWVNLHGYGGLAAGLDLIRGMMEKFWESLFPQIEEGDMDYRIGPLAFLDEKLPHAVFQVPITDPQKTKGYSYYKFEESRLVGFGQGLSKEQKTKREALIGEGKVSGEEFAAAVNLTPILYYRKISDQLEHCRKALQDLDKVVNEKCAPNPPGFTHLMQAVEACAHAVGRIIKDKLRSEVIPQDELDTASTKNAPGKMIDVSDPEPRVIGRDAISIPFNSIQASAISDVSAAEKELWQQASDKLEKGRLKEAVDQLLSAAVLSPSIREKNRYLLLLAKLCLKADRSDLASPIAEELYKTIETLQLEKWEHPSWIAEVIETLYRCLGAADEAQSERARTLFQKLCLLNVAKAAAYREG